MNARATVSNTAAEMLLAFVSASVWFVILFAVSYPVEQWLGVAAIAYVSLCVSRVTIANVVVFMLARLHRRGEKALARAGIESAEPKSESDGGGFLAATALFLLCVIIAIFGSTVTIVGAWTSAAGLFPLSQAFGYVGWAMLAIGAITLASFFASAHFLFSRAEAQSKLTGRVSGIEKSESLLRRVGFHSVPIRA